MDGYSLLNFTYIYLIGGYIGRFVGKDFYASHRWGSLCVYILCAIVWGACNILRLYVDIPFGNNHGYNNPVVILGALALLVFMLSFNFHNKIVNWIAAGAFATYLITDTSYVGYYLYTSYSRFIHLSDMQLWQVIVVTMFSAMVILLLCSCIDRLRAW